MPIDQIHLEFGGGGGGSGGGGGGGGGFDDLPTTNAGGNDIAAGGVEGDIASPNLFGSVPVYSRVSTATTVFHRGFSHPASIHIDLSTLPKALISLHRPPRPRPSHRASLLTPRKARARSKIAMMPRALSS